GHRVRADDPDARHGPDGRAGERRRDGRGPGGHGPGPRRAERLLSGSYQPNDFTCNGTTGWTTPRPAARWPIKAVRTVFTPQNATKERVVALQVTQRVKETTTVGRDVWTWGAYINAVNASNVTRGRAAARGRTRTGSPRAPR